MSNVYDFSKQPFFQKGPGFIIAVVIGLLAIVLISSSFQTVGPGEKGVIFSRFGGIQDRILNEGLQFKIPFVEFIIPVDVRVQKAQTDATASTSDLQTVSSTIAVNYHIDPDKVNTVYQKIGVYFKDRVIDPAVQESVKAATAQYSAKELITKREEVKDNIKENLRARLTQFNILVDELNIIDFTFSKSFNDAIEQKQTADQLALKAEMDLERIKIEAKQLVATAEAEAKSQKLQSITITKNVLQLRAIEKWDGKLPQVTGGGAMPFIDINSMRK